MTERERQIRKDQILNRQMDRLEKCLIAEEKAEIAKEKAEKARRRYWSTRGGPEAQMIADYKRWLKRREKVGLTTVSLLSLLRNEPKR